MGLVVGISSRLIINSSTMPSLLSQSVLLLTACVHPNGMTQTALQDAAVRQQQYIEALRYYLSTLPCPIVMVENTGVDFATYFPEAVASGQLETLTFEGNRFDRSLGKGYGEGEIVRYAFVHSRRLREAGLIVKITGSHCVLNLRRILALSELCVRSTERLVICEAKPYRQLARSDMFVASPAFYQHFFLSALERIDEAQGVWFEHVLYDAVCAAVREGHQFVFTPQRLSQQGLSGTHAKPLKKASCLQNLRHLCKMLLFHWDCLKLSQN